jgi:hypothetical protein
MIAWVCSREEDTGMKREGWMDGQRLEVFFFKENALLIACFILYSVAEPACLWYQSLPDGELK